MGGKNCLHILVDCLPHRNVAERFGLRRSKGLNVNLTVKVLANQPGHMPGMGCVLSFPEEGLGKPKADLLEGIPRLPILSFIRKQ